MEGTLKKVVVGIGGILVLFGILIAGRFPGFYFNEILVGAGYVMAFFGVVMIVLGLFQK